MSFNKSDQTSGALWMEPDLEALPEPVSLQASRVLFSAHAPLPSDDDPQTVSRMDEATALDPSSWLDLVTGILRIGSDWELYSYVLVHMGSQLTNHALFNGSIQY